jgi:hypothetical protein
MGRVDGAQRVRESDAAPIIDSFPASHRSPPDRFAVCPSPRGEFAKHAGAQKTRCRCKLLTTAVTATKPKTERIARDAQ